jgi:hypothetical protein
MAAAAERYAGFVTAAPTSSTKALYERVFLVSDWGLDSVSGVCHYKKTTS